MTGPHVETKTVILNVVSAAAIDDACNRMGLQGYELGPSVLDEGILIFRRRTTRPPEWTVTRRTTPPVPAWTRHSTAAGWPEIGFIMLIVALVATILARLG